MLGRQNDLGDADRLAVLIFDRHLAFGVWSKLLASPETSFSFEGKILKNFVCVVDWRWHELVCFAAGIAEHDSLIARPLILIAGGVDALRDVGGLA